MTRRATSPARPRRPRPRLAAVAVALLAGPVAGVAGCDASPEQAGPPATVPGSASPPMGSTVAAAQDGQESPAPPAAADLAAGSEIVAAHGELGPRAALPPNPGGGTAGSGCRPGPSATLPDGVWMVRLVRVGGDGAGVAGLDLVCFSTGESLAAAGAAPSGAGDAVANDNPRLREVPLAGDVSYYLQSPGPPTPAGQATRRVAFSAEQRGELGVWLARNGPVLAWALVRGGTVAEVYAPPLVAP